MTQTFEVDGNQKFSCRDCPARCCRMPWGYPVTPSEKDRISALPWVAARFASLGVAFNQLSPERYGLPSIEKNRRLQCAFLDEDNLCSIHKREGVDATPQTCQTFPLRFIEKEDGTLQTYLSHVCPSIRDNYGEPLAPQLPERLAQMQGLTTLKLVPYMSLGLGRIEQKDYLSWADQAAQFLMNSPSPASALVQLEEWTSAIASAVPMDGTHNGDFPNLQENPFSSVSPARPSSWAKSTRLLLAFCLAPASYPMMSGRPLSRFELLKFCLHKLNFILKIVRQKGSADMLFVNRPVPLAEVFSIHTALSHPDAQRRLAKFLSQLLIRRNFFFSQKSLGEVLFHLALTGALVSVFARLHAVSQNRSSCEVQDFVDGESLAELILTYHGSAIKSHKALRTITEFMANYPPAFQGLVEAF